MSCDFTWTGFVRSTMLYRGQSGCCCWCESSLLVQDWRRRLWGSTIYSCMSNNLYTYFFLGSSSCCRIKLGSGVECGGSSNKLWSKGSRQHTFLFCWGRRTQGAIRKVGFVGFAWNEVRGYGIQVRRFPTFRYWRHKSSTTCFAIACKISDKQKLPKLCFPCANTS